jgi:hypothetical protein
MRSLSEKHARRNAMQQPLDKSPTAGDGLPDLTRETLLSLAQAARRFPPYRANRPVNPSTIWRWCRQGVKVPGVGVVKLECVRLSGRWLTSEEAISRFVARQTPAVEAAPMPRPRTERQVRSASQQAARELEKVGI